jgi:hypothetical protein
MSVVQITAPRSLFPSYVTESYASQGEQHELLNSRLRVTIRSLPGFFWCHRPLRYPILVPVAWKWQIFGITDAQYCPMQSVWVLYPVRRAHKTTDLRLV